MIDQNPPSKVTVVLRASEGQTLESILPFLPLGAPVAIGRGTAVISSVSDGDALVRTEMLDDPASPIHEAIGLLEHAADEFTKHGLQILAEGYNNTAELLRVHVGVPKLSLLELDRITDSPSSASASERGSDLLRAVERVARHVIQRELVCGGLIERAIEEARP